jgi:hypothetical protein
MLSKNPGIVDDLNYGVYIWRDGKGRAVVDSDYNYLMIASKKGDAKKIRLLTEAVRSFGIMDGAEEFCAGSRPISDAEFEVQKERQENGLVPDEYDLGNLIDEFNYQKELDKQ